MHEWLIWICLIINELESICFCGFPFLFLFLLFCSEHVEVKLICWLVTEECVPNVDAPCKVSNIFAVVEIMIGWASNKWHNPSWSEVEFVSAVGLFTCEQFEDLPEEKDEDMAMAAQENEGDGGWHGIGEEIVHGMSVLRDHRPISFVLVVQFVEFVKETYFMEYPMSSILEDVLDVVN